MLSFLVALVFLGLNILFVLVEYSLVRVPASRVEVLARQGNSRARRLQYMLKHLDNYLSAVQLGVTAASLGLGWLGQPGLTHLLYPVMSSFLPPAAVEMFAHGLSLALSFMALTFFQIVVGELAPRAIAIQKAEAIALWAAWPFEVFYRTFRMPIVMMARTSTGIVRLLGFRPAAEHEQVFSEEEIRILLGASQEKGLMSLDRLLVMENLFDFGKLKARDAMVPPDKIAFLSLTKPWEENQRTIRARRFSRYPLCETDLSQVVGIVHIKDLLLSEGTLMVPDLRKIKREPSLFLETEPLPTVFKSMLAKGKQMALLRDAAGKITGLLTLEDIVEELVGEIHDEFDLPGAWSLSALLSPDLIDLDLKGESPQEVIRSLLRRLNVVDLNKTYAAVWSREAAFPTGIGKGLAVPHARLTGLDRSYVLIGRSNLPLGFPHPDGTPVRLIFLLLTPVTVPLEQVRLLSRIALLGSNESLRRRLLKAKTPEVFLDVLRTSETILAG